MNAKPERRLVPKQTGIGDDDLSLRSPPHNFEAEVQLLGAILSNNRAFFKVNDFLRPEHFTDPRHARIFEACAKLINRGQLATSTMLKNFFEQDATLTEIGGTAYLGRLAGAAVTIINAEEHGRIIQDLSLRRQLIGIGEDIVNRAYAHDLETDGTDQTHRAVEELLGLIKDGAGKPRNTRQVREAIVNGMKAELPCYSTGLSRLDSSMGGGLYQAKAYGIIARKKAGKAQPLWSKVLTTRGWKTMAEMRVGDQLASPDGITSEVTGVFPQGVKPVYRVRFSDGRAAEACGDHLWTVYGYRGKGAEDISTVELLRRSRLSLPTYVPAYLGDHGVDGQLPIHPYVLGVLLGDGGFSTNSVYVTSADKFILDDLERLLPVHLTLKKTKEHGYDYRIVNRTATFAGSRGRTRRRAFKENSLKNALISLGLMGAHSSNKFVPDAYMKATRESRLELIRGLVDTDGHVSKHGIQFTTTSSRLALQMRDLVRSVGGLCTIRTKSTFAVNGDVRTPGKLAYICQIRHERSTDLVKLPRKKARIPARRIHGCRLRVIGGELIGEFPVQCISVSHPLGLYVTDDYVVTHNTILGGQISYALNAAKEPHLYIASEMGAEEIEQRSMARDMGINALSFIDKRARQKEGFITRAAEWAVATPGYGHWVDAAGLTFERLKREVMHAIRVLHIKGFILDYLQLVGGVPRGKTRTEHLEDVCQWIAEICRKYGIWAVVLAQMNQEGNVRHGEGIRLAFDWVAELKRDQGGTGTGAWFEIMDTRYTFWTDVGSEAKPAMILNTKVGPHFEETQEPVEGPI